MINLKNYYQPTNLENGMVRVHKKPHVSDLEHLDSACSAPATGVFYFVSRYLGIDIDGELLLTELTKLQDNDPESITYGCMKWYRESTRIQDTNSAFFTLRNICYTLKFCKHNIPKAELDIIFPFLRTAVNWFKKECSCAQFFYPNKTMSDGALLVLLSDLLNDKTLIDNSIDFWIRWMDYTDEYGWGWGENTSKEYTNVMKEALIIALMGLKQAPSVYNRLLSVYKRMLEYCAYHGEYEFTPSIRTYNYTGKAIIGKNPADKDIFNFEHIDNEAIAQIIILQNAPNVDLTPDQSNFHKERIFGDSYALTYKGENIRLGSVTKFPVMRNCYEGRGWGLGWQSMPVSAIALKHETAFMRFVTISNGELRCHMSTGIRDKNLFPDLNIPKIYTCANQEKNMAVVVRMVEQIANTSSFFSDEWYFQNFNGKIQTFGEWYIFNYGDCALCIKSFDNKLEIQQDGNKVRLINKFYEGEEQLLVINRDIHSWAIVALDNCNNIEKELSEIQTSKKTLFDPRYSRFSQPFILTCGESVLNFDPDTVNLF